jgi:peptidyl-prolyl cis-trans isomerase B (cyclophilin B)
MKSKSIFYLLTIAVLASACSKRIPAFSIVAPADDKAPAQYSFINESKDFDSYEWSIGTGEIIKDDSIVSHRYLLSGNYNIVLSGKKGKKIKQIEKEIHVSAPDKCLVQIETSQGIMIAELYDDTPQHRDNFLKLAEEGYYNGLLFHRVMNGFMIQGGDPGSRTAPPNAPLGTGGPGYQVSAEFNANHAHVKGAIAAARTPDTVNPERKSSGSQFYIVHGGPVTRGQLQQMEQRTGIPYSDELIKEYETAGGYPFLDQQYTVYGRVIEGLDVIDKIAAVKTDARDRPNENVTMKITVIK